MSVRGSPGNVCRLEFSILFSQMKLRVFCPSERDESQEKILAELKGGSESRRKRLGRIYGTLSRNL